jgi:integrase
MLRKMARRIKGYREIRNMVMLLVGFFALLRVLELMKLRWRDVRWMRKRVVLNVY